MEKFVIDQSGKCEAYQRKMSVTFMTCGQIEPGVVKKGLGLFMLALLKISLLKLAHFVYDGP